MLEFTGAELLPIDTILGNDAVACNFGEHHAQGEYISGLVELTTQRFRCQVVTVAFAINVLGCRPLAGKAKVGNLEPALEIDQYVRRLQVEVDVAGLVDEFETLRPC